MFPIHSAFEPGVQAPPSITVAVVGVGFLHLLVSNFSLYQFRWNEEQGSQDKD